MRLAALCSLPFAFSEFLFYPDYWAPTFLFDLGDRLGFGIVVFLYLTGLGFFFFIGWPGPGSLKTYLLVAYPLLATAVMALLIKDGPAGHWRCNAFVALAVSSVVITMATLAGDLLLTGFSGRGKAFVAL